MLLAYSILSAAMLGQKKKHTSVYHFFWPAIFHVNSGESDILRDVAVRNGPVNTSIYRIVFSLHRSKV